MERLDFSEIFSAFCALGQRGDHIQHLALKLNWRADDNGGLPSTFCIGDDKPLKAFVEAVNDYLETNNDERKERAFCGVCWALTTCDPDGLTNELSAGDYHRLFEALALCADWAE